MINFTKQDNSLRCSFDSELLIIEPWGTNGLRVRATRLPQIKPDWPGALSDPGDYAAQIEMSDTGATIQNGAMKAVVSSKDELTFWNAASGVELLQEKPIHTLSVPARFFKDTSGDLFHIEVCFEAHEDEHLYGLGQHQHGLLDQKGCVIDLIQRNTEVSIPFLVSSRGYGFLWNNPAIGRVELGQDATRWVAEASPQIDYWITTGDSPAEILSHYADVTGHPPMLPDWASGFWQSKLRYSSQEQLEAVAHEYHQRHLPLSAIVIDFFHWTRQGEWQFNPTLWPDPSSMVKTLESMGTKVVVSVWPTVNRLSPNYQEMAMNGYMIRNTKGTPAHAYFVDNQSEEGIYIHYYDSTHPGARQYIWERVKQGYYAHGIKAYWLDACEPEIVPMMPENLRFYAGDGQAVANIYPREHTRGFYEAMKAEGETEIAFLSRSGWAGSQRYGAIIWSGDVYSTFAALKAQVRAGLNMALSGIPWWNSDIGGFRGGNPTSPEFRELLIRWFQFGAFCPIFRLHGHRLPNTNDFGGADNEVWSFGEEAYGILKQYLFIRERLRPYIMEQMRCAHEIGLPPMRPLFVDFPSDSSAYQIEDQYMFGPELLVAPVTDAGARTRNVYLPAGSTWKHVWTDNIYEGGQQISIDAPLEQIPLFLRDDAYLPIREESVP